MPDRLRACEPRMFGKLFVQYQGVADDHNPGEKNESELAAA